MEQVVNVKITAIPLYAQAFFLLLSGKRFPAERRSHLFNTFATKIIKSCAKANLTLNHKLLTNMAKANFCREAKDLHIKN